MLVPLGKELFMLVLLGVDASLGSRDIYYKDKEHQ